MSVAAHAIIAVTIGLPQWGSGRDPECWALVAEQDRLLELAAVVLRTEPGVLECFAVWRGKGTAVMHRMDCGALVQRVVWAPAGSRAAVVLRTEPGVMGLVSRFS